MFFEVMFEIELLSRGGRPLDFFPVFVNIVDHRTHHIFRRCHGECGGRRLTGDGLDAWTERDVGNTGFGPCDFLDVEEHEVWAGKVDTIVDHSYEPADSDEGLVGKLCNGSSVDLDRVHGL